jgi:diguanylate cyclase (GGDEF)-like protein
MQAAPSPTNEISRISALRLLHILDTQPEERFDRLTRLAKALFDVPIAQVTLVDEHRQWFKSGADGGPPEGPREFSFCAHAILSDEILMVPDAVEDERFFDNPLVLGDPRIRFYAGYPLKVGAHNLGTLCVIDNKPRSFGEEELHLLRDLGELARQELAAMQLATTDHLTSISNRRGFEVLGRHALAVCRRMEQSATLLYFDLDYFKHINDAHGHAAGDQALRIFAQGLTAVFRESDVVGRLGGDEFAVLLTGSRVSNARVGLGRLEDWLTTHTPGVGLPAAIHFSAGYVEFDPQGNHSIEHLMLEADAAMYRRKKSARASY